MEQVAEMILVLGLVREISIALMIADIVLASGENGVIGVVGNLKNPATPQSSAPQKVKPVFMLCPATQIMIVNVHMAIVVKTTVIMLIAARCVIITEIKNTDAPGEQVAEMTLVLKHDLDTTTAAARTQNAAVPGKKSHGRLIGNI